MYTLYVNLMNDEIEEVRGISDPKNVTISDSGAVVVNVNESDGSFKQSVVYAPGIWYTLTVQEDRE